MDEFSPAIADAAPMTLEVVNERLKAIVEDKTKGRQVAVQGLATEVSRTRSGHLHFKIRQDKYGLACVVFRSIARQLPFWVRDGQKLLVQGEIAVDAVWGELQIVAQRLVLMAAAPGEDALKALKAQAKAAGWLDPARKREIPRLPQCIGLIAGPQSRALGDVKGSLNDAGITGRTEVQPISMQGPDVAEKAISALNALNAKAETDVIVIARGGGNKRELNAFNDWGLAATIVASRIPVLVAIGHRDDVTLADLVADRSLPTPSLVGAVLAGKTAKDTTPRLYILAAVMVACSIVLLLLILALSMGWL